MDKKKSTIPISHARDAESQPSPLPALSKQYLFNYLFDPDRTARLRSGRERAFGFASSGKSAASPLLDAKPTTYLRIERVRAITGLATSTLYRLMKHGQFPRPMQLGPKCVGWSERDIAEWCKTRKPRRPRNGD